MSFLCRIAGIYIRNRVKYSAVQESLRVESLLLQIQRSQLKRLRHLDTLDASLSRFSGHVQLREDLGKHDLHSLLNLTLQFCLYLFRAQHCCQDSASHKESHSKRWKPMMSNLGNMQFCHKWVIYKTSVFAFVCIRFKKLDWFFFGLLKNIKEMLQNIHRKVRLDD